MICPLSGVESLGAGGAASMSMELASRALKFSGCASRGELLVSLCFQPATNKLTAVVLKAKNLPKFDVTGLAGSTPLLSHWAGISLSSLTADPYVKVYMLYNGQRVGKKKTHVKKRTLSPVYNESFVFDLPSSDPGALDAVSFEFLLMDWDRVTKNEAPSSPALPSSPLPSPPHLSLSWR